MFARRLYAATRTTASHFRYCIEEQCSLSLTRRRFFSSISRQQPIEILFASQTGTAQLFAHQLAEGLEDKGFEGVKIKSLNEDPPNKVFTPGHLHLLLTSCTGVGEPPDNARHFYEWIMNTNSNSTLSDSINFACFGLGNKSSHPNNYNVVAKQLDARLEELGAHRVKELVLGDDGDCIEDDFDQWMEQILKLVGDNSHSIEEDSPEESGNMDSSILNQYTQEEETEPHIMRPAGIVTTADNTRRISKKRPNLSLSPAVSDAIRSDLFHLQGTSQQFYSDKTAKLKVLDNRLLASDAGEAGLHELQVSLEQDGANSDNASSLSYTTGDHLLVYPRNSDAIVQAYVDILDVDHNAIIVDDESQDDSYPHPKGITVMETLSHCVDLGAPPSPAFARMILGCKELDYKNEIAIPRRTVIDLLHEAGKRLSLEDLLYNAAPMKPRYYSIASSNLKQPNEIHLVFRPVRYMTSKGYLREGVCTSFMCHKGATRKGANGAACLLASINENPSFRLPKDPKTPVMFIGGGCGVAPIRAFIEERICLAEERASSLGPAILYMGYRDPHDEVYKDLVQKAMEAGALTEAETVYSRGCNKSNQSQMFVSDLVRAESKKVWNHIQNGGHVYLCGGAHTFGVPIEGKLLEIFKEYGNMNFDQATEYLRDIIRQGRLAEDLSD